MPSKFSIYLSVIILLVLIISGCASEPIANPITSAIPTSATLSRTSMAIITPNTPGVYHRVEKGETLWRICKSYNVDLEEVAELNRIADSKSIEVGQKIFIPNAKTQHVIAVLAMDNDEFIWPIKGTVISGFGQISSDALNKGINIEPKADVNVVASRKGKVVFYSNDFGIFGKTIIIEHADGLSTVYSRNGNIYVKVGDMVQKGALLGRAGRAGRDKRVYLHFEVRKGSVAQNPLFYLP
ncbi:MAG: LysM peptidoglycan-binding domain-containing M23 family metallopeptidase [Candidatus Omnitrophica bacterium]|nr:LysM peptidoglycan-binding domain-containing M23 family metallopeptidase [Candidatus Omnitrophota bacterium]